MKIETLIIGHTVFSGAGTAGTAWALSETRVELLLLPLAVALFFFISDISKLINLRKNARRGT